VYYVRLRFDTKDIAQNTDVQLKSVQMKKKASQENGICHRQRGTKLHEKLKDL
jgi:hypothetical protein